MTTARQPVIIPPEDALLAAVDVLVALQEQDKTLGDKLLAELPGILAWAVRGCLAWQREGLGIPPAVVDATAAYRAESDELAPFLEECCNQGEKLQSQAGPLFKAYQAWAEANGILTRDQLTNVKFGRQLQERGFDKYKDPSSRQTFYTGLELVQKPPEKPAASSREEVFMALASIDTERIKTLVDLQELAGRYTTLAKWSTKELAGPCPRGTCTAKTNGFHVHADGWFCCYTCHPKHGDAIEFLQWLGVAADFKAACQYLDAGAVQLPAPARRVTPQAKPAGWQDASWQSDARAILARAQDCLASPAGDPGAEYLLRRGILSETWQAWGLGYDPAKWDPATERKRPAVVIPWQRDKVTAVKYRFTDSTSKGDRFTQKGGGQQIAFGLNLAGAHWSTLWLCEGEFNALSIWQALRAAWCVNFDVVSFGGDSQAAHLDPVVKAWAGKYRQAIVWADEPAKAAAAMAAIPGAFGLRSPEVDGRKLDANELLKLGGLADFARAAWAKFGQDPAYIARLQAEIEALPGLDGVN